MQPTTKKTYGFQTQCLHAGDHRNQSGHVSPPISLSTAFVFPDTTEGARRAADIEADEFYGRWGSTNAREFEALIAGLEGADDAVCASSGLGIISMVAHAFLNPGDHFVGVHACYSETKILLESLAKQLSLDATFIQSDRIENFEQAIRPDTKLVFAETPANPTLSLVDIEGVARIVREKSDAAFAVDSTFASPYNQNPLALGADIVIHSATKYIGGHSDVVAGVCAARKPLAHQVRDKFSFHGPHLDPFSSWLLCRGIRTLGLRIRQQNENALELAHYLESHPKVNRVYYPMLESHPQHTLARRQMRGGGGMICFEIQGGMEASLRFISTMQLSKLAVSLGGVSSTITHPSSMTHNLLPREEREKAGITDGMLRFSVGIEEVDDLKEDLEEAFRKI
ncbi:trans-sulfuration enzyme family protein [Desmospora profundinema]|uniref:Methionine-gamma-lyase n=1 Tax=Desmospora profundinema TaxID=1571184 RepID=A0ABU1IQ12_9BACL|nr:aminotransferase class I/II-fold pyridoxal phosphate-dependent enzyme [Desmospora profundinema]MDR6226806.1 methionine-gamma-lyase [Desmospora profundinema]